MYIIILFNENTKTAIVLKTVSYLITNVQDPQKGVVRTERLSDDFSMEELERMGIQSSMDVMEVLKRLKDYEDTIRKNIQRELKIKEGAEKMKEVSGDRKGLGGMIKESMLKLDELNLELKSVQNYELMIETEGTNITSNCPTTRLLYHCFH